MVKKTITAFYLDVAVYRFIDTLGNLIKVNVNYSDNSYTIVDNGNIITNETRNVITSHVEGMLACKAQKNLVRKLVQ